MKKATRIYPMVVALMLITSCAFAISLADGYESSGIKRQNTHQHILTSPSKIFGFLVTATANGGYACLVSTLPQADATDAHREGEQFYLATSSKVLADVGQATAANSIFVSWPDGIKCGDNLFLDCVNAKAEVYYKE